MSPCARLVARGLGMALLAGLFAGCTIFYEPTLEPSDGGTDSRVEAGPDGGLDGGPDAIVTERECDDGLDNDGDKLVDCNDYDCSYLEACCQMQSGTEVVDEPWTEGTTHWDVYGSTPEVSSNRINLRAGSTALVWKECTVADLGLYGTFSFQPEIAPGDNCEAQYISLGFATAREPDVNTQFRSEIEVRVNACGRYEVLRGSTRLTQIPIAPINPTGLVRFQITPGTLGGEEVMRATISLDDGVQEQVLVEGLPFMSRDEMLDIDACGGLGRGLYLFIEGTRSDQRMSLDGIEFSTAQCANPSQFVRADLGGSAQFDVSDVNPGPAWSAGGMGSPTLLPFGSSGNWWVLYDATPDPRQIAEFHPLVFGLGRASTTSTGWDPRTAPIADENNEPESCQEKDCRNLTSYRDPFIFDGVIAYTRTVGGRPSIVMETYGLSGALNLRDAVLTAEDTTFVGLDAPACPDGVSQPTFARVPFTSPAITQYWLFFTCHNEEKRSLGYQLVQQQDDIFSVSGSGGVLFGADGIGQGYAAGGIESPEIMVEYGEEPHAVYRLWFIARDQAQRRSVALAQWQPSQLNDPPDFVLFPGNPVLEASDSEADCEAGCKLESLAVARDTDQLRFLLAQSVNAFGEVTYRIISLEQNWSRPTWPKN